MSTVAISNHYISPGSMMYGQQGNGSQPNLYEHKLYDTSKVYGDSTSNANAATAAAAYTSWQTPFKYESLPTNWSSTAAANAWYGHQTQGLNLGHIVKPELHDYTR